MVFAVRSPAATLLPSMRTLRCCLDVLFAAAAIGGPIAGCRGSQGNAAPSIEFVTVPEANPAVAPTAWSPSAVASRRSCRSADRAVRQERRLVGAAVVRCEPFTQIEADGTWKSTIHLGHGVRGVPRRARHTVLPPPSTSLPKPGGPVHRGVDRSRAPATSCAERPQDVDIQRLRMGASARFPAIAAARTTTIRRTRGPMPQGYLHLQDSRSATASWTSAEVILTRSLGYGTYVFVVRDTSPARSGGGAGSHDLGRPGRRPEPSRAGHRDQPVGRSARSTTRSTSSSRTTVPANVARFAAPPGSVTHTFRWEPGRSVTFTTVPRRPGTATATPPSSEHDSRRASRFPGTETIRIDPVLTSGIRRAAPERGRGRD